VATLRQRTFSEKTIIFEEGRSDDCCYILLEGQVEIIKTLGATGERHLGLRESGSLLGEMSLFSQTGAHTASVRARTPVVAMEITRADIDALLHRRPLFAYELIRTLSQRLEQSEALTILELLEKNRQITQAYEELKAAQTQIIEKERLEKELEVARQIQRSILPQVLPHVPGMDFGALMVPARAVGGDFYDFILLGKNRLGIVVGDVSDKGTPAALFMALSYSLVRAEARRHGNPGETVRAVNQHLLEMNNSGMFVTLVYGILDITSSRFDYARAGHPMPLILNHASQQVTLPTSYGQALGLFDDLKLDEGSVTIPNGGMALVFSDGMSEAANPRGNEFNQESLYTVMKGIKEYGSQAICQNLWEAVNAFTNPLPQQDDFTLVCIKNNK
jgi:sigma-B regulation protein RsbU (phosphoserine phosphatase)